MAVIRKKVGKPTKSVPAAKASQKAEVSLPDRISSPSDRLGDYSILLYGEKKIGKTLLASKFKDAFFLMFEPGAKAISIFKKPVSNWLEFKAYVALLKKDKRFATVVIDPVDLAYKACLQYVCEKLVIDYPSDEDWGKGWNAIRDEFTSEINSLLRLDKGVILISHATEKEIKTRTGDKYDKICPTMSKQAREVLEGIVDIWIYVHYEGKERILTIIGDDHVGAGHRLEGRFLYTNGSLVKEIPMGTNAAEAYKNFTQAFDNKFHATTVTKPKVTIKRRK